MKREKTIVFTGPERWNYNSNKCQSGFECYFYPTTIDCGISNTSESNEEFGVFLGTANFYSNSSASEDFEIIKNINLLQPPTWVSDELNEGSRWWEAQMANALFCLNDKVSKAIDQFRLDNGWSYDDHNVIRKENTNLEAIELSYFRRCWRDSIDRHLVLHLRCLK